MAIRISGPLPIQEIADEFLDTAAPNRLAEYYGDGAFLSQGYFPTVPPVPNRRRPNVPVDENNTISISDFYGKGRRFPINIRLAANTANYNPINDIRASLSSNGIPLNVEVDVTITVNSGVTVYGTSTDPNSPAIVIPPNDESRNTGIRAADVIKIVNNGNIVGAPGSGGSANCGPNAAGVGGTGGGVAVWLRRATVIENNGIIAGGAPGGRGGNGGQTRTGRSCNCQTCYSTCQQQYIAGYAQGGACNGGGGGGCQKGMKSGSSSRQRQAQYANRNVSCNPYSCNCQTCYDYANTCGGRGGDGASVFNNVRPAGAGSGGGNYVGAQNGAAGGLWGEGDSIWLRGAGNAVGGVGGDKRGATS